MQLKINGKIYNAKEGETILDICRREGIRIPTLCFLEELSSADGNCRLCLVKTNKHQGLVHSCQTPASDLLEVVTENEDIKKARTINLELLWADHVGRCPGCKRNGFCELQNLAKEYKIDIRDFVPSLDAFEKEEQLKLLKESLKNRVIDDGNPSICRDSQYCIECKRCVRVCKEIQTVESYGMNNRSIKTNVGTPGNKPLDCIFCGQCSVFCPTAAITEKDDIDKVEKIMADEKKLKLFQVAPSVRFSLGEMFGMESGVNVEKKIVGALRKMGADLVFDTTFSADLTIMEEANELAGRIQEKLGGKKDVALPMFTSCCPSWVLYVEKYWPQFIVNLSSCKSPQQMLGALVKAYFAKKKRINPENIALVSIMPCTAKKYEAARPEMSSVEGVQDVDAVLTTRELGRWLKGKGVNLSVVEESDFDRSLGTYSGAGVIFGSSGGVMEAALRTAYEKMTDKKLDKLDFVMLRGEQGIKEAEVTFPKGNIIGEKLKIKVAVANEIRNAKKILEMMEAGRCDYDFVEVMACPGGCLGGGGQPLPASVEKRKERREAIYNRDKHLPIRRSHENPSVLKVYDDFLEEPGSEIAEKYLHTKYINRKDGE